MPEKIRKDLSPSECDISYSSSDPTVGPPPPYDYSKYTDGTSYNWVMFPPVKRMCSHFHFLTEPLFTYIFGMLNTIWRAIYLQLVRENILKLEE